MMNDRAGLRYLPLAVGLGAFIVLTYLVCTVWDALVPDNLDMRAGWEPFLPGYTWWSWGSFLLGLVESFVYGFWLALALPLVRWASRRGRGTA